jgi:hypothetical protein
MLPLRRVAKAGLCSAILSKAILMARVTLIRARSQAEAARRSRPPNPTAHESLPAKSFDLILKPIDKLKLVKLARFLELLA